MKLGLYDPESLAMDGDLMTIGFVNARDAGDVTTIHIRTAEEAHRIRDALILQKNEVACPFHPISGELSILSGAFQFSKDHPSEGLIGHMEQSGGKKKLVPVPFRLGFEAEQGQLPPSGRCIAKGYMEDGALFVLHMAMVPAGAMPDGEPAPNTPSEDR